MPSLSARGYCVVLTVQIIGFVTSLRTVLGCVDEEGRTAKGDYDNEDCIPAFVNNSRYEI